MKNMPTTLAVLLLGALLIVGCQSSPPASTTATESAKPAETKPETNPVLVPPPAQATQVKPAESAPAPAPEPAGETMTVAEMQKRLAELGYQPGPADGVAGKKTLDALKKFQHANHLPATGTLDNETMRRLRSAKR